MEEQVYFYIPKEDELSYRQEIMSQKDTMAYNKGYNVAEKGYHKDTGCIDFPKDSWNTWYASHVDNKPKSFYAYIARKYDNEFIGEVNLHWNAENDWYELGILIESKYRNKGYSKEALRKLIDVAFNKYNALSVHNTFEDSRDAAIKIHTEVGFHVISKIDGFIEMLMTKGEYARLK